MSLLRLYQRVWGPACNAVSDIEANGIGVDCGVLAASAEAARRDIDELAQELESWAGGVNFGSPVQLAEFLYDVKGWDVPPVCGSNEGAVRKAPRGKRPTDYVAVKSLSDRAEHKQDRDSLRKLLEWKKNTKLAQFMELLPRYVYEGRIHPKLAASTETGRLASNTPNLQQIPARSDRYGIRSAFRAVPGRQLVVADYSSLEWRILAHILAQLFDDWSLVDEVEQGIDPHWVTAQALHTKFQGVDYNPLCKEHKKARAHGKTLNYGINYGKSGAGLGYQFRDEHGEPIGKAAGEAYLNRFYEGRPGILRWHKWIKSYAIQRGYVKSLLGRPRYLPDISDGERWKRQKAERLALNTPIQSSAADIVMAAMARVTRNLRPGWMLVLQVHDELILEVPEAEAEDAKHQLQEDMEQCLEGFKTLKCPLEVEANIGRNWGEAK